MPVSRSSVAVAGLFALVFITCPDTATADIVNGDLTGPVATGSAPTDWFNWQNTPDTCDTSGPFNNTPNPWVASPNGGTFARMAGSTRVSSEAIAQDVSGFTAGAFYELSFHQCNLGFEHPTSGAWNGTEGYFEVRVDGGVVAETPVLFKPATNVDPIEWSFVTVAFTAPADAFELAIVARSASDSGLAAYMAIDGLFVHEGCPGNTNGDPVVDVIDLVNVILDWGTNGQQNGGDVDFNGSVDVLDVVFVVLHWGQQCPAP